MLVYTSNEGIPGRETFGFNAAVAVIGLRSMSQKSKKFGQKLPLSLFLPSLASTV